MEVKLLEQGTEGKFYIEVEGVEAAHMTFKKLEAHCIKIDHTEVNPVLRGKGAAKQLLMEAVRYARDNNLTIIPVCEFVKGVFKKTPEIADVLKT